MNKLYILAALLVLCAAPAVAQAPGPRRADVQLLGVPERYVAPVMGRRPSWRYPLVGAALGVVAGIGVGAYLHSRIEPGNTLSGPPAYVLTVPLGAIGGLVLGVIANGVHPPTDAR